MTRTKHDQALKGKQAAELLANPLFSEAIEGVNKQLIDKLCDAQLDGSEKADKYALELIRCMQASRRVTKWLGMVINSGKVAEKEIERKSLRNPRGI